MNCTAIDSNVQARRVSANLPKIKLRLAPQGEGAGPISLSPEGISNRAYQGNSALESLWIGMRIFGCLGESRCAGNPDDCWFRGSVAVLSSDYSQRCRGHQSPVARRKV